MLKATGRDGVEIAYLVEPALAPIEMSRSC